MAKISFGRRIEANLRILVSHDLTGKDDKVKLVCQMAATAVEGKLGPVGEFDSENADLGDQEALRLGVLIAHCYLGGNMSAKEPMAELEQLREARVEEASDPVVIPPNKTPIRRRTWDR